MNQAEVMSFLQSLGCQKIFQQPNGWVRASCPLARWKHQKMRDDHPSFAVSVKPGDRSWCNCQACGFSGDPLSLVWALEKHQVTVKPNAFALASSVNRPSPEKIADRLKRASQRATQEAKDDQGVSLPTTFELGGVQVSKGLYWGCTQDELLPPWPDSALHHLMDIPGEVIAYLRGQDRNLTDRSIAEWELGYHAPTGRITMPIRDYMRRIVNVTGRACLGYSKPKYRHGPNNRLYLYGENRVIKGRRGYILEGNFDPIYLTQCGYTNAVSLMGTELSPIRAEKIVQWFSEVYVALDPDKAGDEGTLKLIAKLQDRLPVKRIMLPEGKDVDQIRVEHVRALFGNPNS